MDGTAWQSGTRSLPERLTLRANALFARRIDRVREAIREETNGANLAEKTLRAMGVTWTLAGGQRLELPSEGSVVVVANHPFGGVEGLILLRMACESRRDVKLLATDMLGMVPEMKPYLILVDTAGDDRARGRNLLAMRECLRWLEGGGVLGVFPAGEVAHYSPATRSIREGEWNHAVARLVRRTGAAVAPVYFDGANGWLFQAAGLAHPRLRTAMLARELFNKRRKPIRVAAAKPVPFRWLKDIGDDRELTDHLRMRVSLLAFPAAAEACASKAVSRRAMQPVAAVSDRQRQASEVAWLSDRHRVLVSGDYSVYVAGAGEIPAVLREIGRQREIAFRGVGEGTGKPLDLDRFDEHYQHLFLWHHQTGEVVGAYRLGLADRIVETTGLGGLYTHSLFRYRRSLFDHIHPAIELGRSFIRPEYQRNHLPLMLLWRGIGRYVARRVKYRYLFGTVSMSRSYSDAARGMVAWYFDGGGDGVVDREDVRPRRPLRWRRGTVPLTLSGRVLRGADDLDRLVSEVEPDGKGLPVLLRQYLRLGGRVLACNVDPEFSMALDALVVVDLCRAESRLLENYMGPATRDYLDFHKANGTRVGTGKDGDDANGLQEGIIRQHERPDAWLHGRGMAHLALRHAL